MISLSSSLAKPMLRVIMAVARIAVRRPNRDQRAGASFLRESVIYLVVPFRNSLSFACSSLEAAAGREGGMKHQFSCASATPCHLLFKYRTEVVTVGVADESKQAGQLLIVQDAAEGRHAVIGEAVEHHFDERGGVAREGVVGEGGADTALQFSTVAGYAVHAEHRFAISDELLHGFLVQRYDFGFHFLGDGQAFE